MPTQAKAVIIGAGRIASTFDSPRSTSVLTHAHAYQKNPNVTLLGFYDTDRAAVLRAAKRWGVTAFASFAAVKAAKPDMVSVCTPDQHHYESLVQASLLSPRIVISEKPLTNKVEESKKILTIYKRKKIPILLNYTYLFDPVIRRFRDSVRHGTYGKVLAGRGTYTKGLLHNGSHIVSLARYFFGEATEMHAEYAVSDFTAQDKSIAGFIRFTRCPQFHLTVADERAFTFFEFDIICEKARITLTDVGFTIHQQNVAADARYTEYRTLARPRIIKTALPTVMESVIANAVSYIQNKTPLICEIDEGLAIQKICETLSSKYRKK